MRNSKLFVQSHQHGVTEAGQVISPLTDESDIEGEMKLERDVAETTVKGT